MTRFGSCRKKLDETQQTTDLLLQASKAADKQVGNFDSFTFTCIRCLRILVETVRGALVTIAGEFR